MKTWTKTPLPWLTACLLSLAATLPSPALTPAEATGILYLKQEEKLARDIYQALGARWAHAVFQRIALAEQRHLEAVDTLIARYGLSDSTPAEAGRFSIPELQQLHDTLLAQGQASLAEALRVGVTVEETDIADLKEAIAAATEAPILRVFGNLLRASTQHLAAYTAVLASDTPTGMAACGAVDCPKAGRCVVGSCPSGRPACGKGACGSGQAACGRGETCRARTAATGQPCAQGSLGQGPANGNQPVTTPRRVPR